MTSFIGRREDEYALLFRHLLPRQLLVEGEIQLENIHVRLPEESQRPVCRMFRDDGRDLLDRDAASLRDARGLQFGVRWADIRIES